MPAPSGDIWAKVLSPGRSRSNSAGGAEGGKAAGAAATEGDGWDTLFASLSLADSPPTSKTPQPDAEKDDDGGWPSLPPQSAPLKPSAVARAERLKAQQAQWEDVWSSGGSDGLAAVREAPVVPPPPAAKPIVPLGAMVPLPSLATLNLPLAQQPFPPLFQLHKTHVLRISNLSPSCTQAEVLHFFCRPQGSEKKPFESPVAFKWAEPFSDAHAGGRGAKVALVAYSTGAIALQAEKANHGKSGPVAFSPMGEGGAGRKQESGRLVVKRERAGEWGWRVGDLLSREAKRQCEKEINEAKRELMDREEEGRTTEEKQEVQDMPGK